MLLWCCLIHISIIIVRQVICLLYLCPCLDLGLFMSYLCDIFFISIFIFIMINRIISLIQTHLFFCSFFRMCPIIFGWYRGWRIWINFKLQNVGLTVLLSICFFIFFPNFSLALLIKVLLIKQRACIR